MTDKYAVIGNPIEHSKSPQIHAAFAEQTGQDIDYGRILGDMEDFPGDVRDFVKSGGKGLNVTVPFKERAWELADENSERAEHAGAVNTILVLCAAPVSSLRAETPKIPSVSISNVTRILISPRGAGRISESRTCPKRVFSSIRRDSP